MSPIIIRKKQYVLIGLLISPDIQITENDML